MSSEVLEIVELDDGGVALRKADDNSAEPVMTVRFSEETVKALKDQHMGVAQSMIAAGIQLIVDAKIRLEEEKEEPVIH
ncbi:MAG: hypothetical protein OQK12_10575 [Motiliproteus sp.]|nr:hypothetical protein [Motiliproteus sp.]MCW9051108.1 hypothetical protein [Motiliproteus sp.]